VLYTPSRTQVQTVSRKVQTEPLWFKKKTIDTLSALTLGCFIKTVTELK